MFYNKLNQVQKLIFLLLLICSFGIFLYYLMANSDINYFDESGYENISKVILQKGLFSIHEPLRTYLYPLIISFFIPFSHGDSQILKIYIEVLQYTVYLFTIVYLAHNSLKIIENKVVWFTIVILGFLNSYLIQATTLMLTDALATCFLVIGFTYLLNSDMKKNINYIIVFGLCFSAVMIRPSSLIFLPILYALILFQYIKYRNLKMSKIIIFSLLLLIIFVPQLYNNIKEFNHWTPLIHENLYSLQSTLATEDIKYATVIIANENPSLSFHSPVLVKHGTNIYHLIFSNFFYFLVLFFSHIFGVIDWGYVDTYIKEYYPFSRIPASILLYIGWFLISLGIISPFKRNGDIFKQNKFKIYSLLVIVLTYILFIGTTRVEARFGYPIFLFLLPFAGFGMSKIADKYSDSKSNKVSIRYISIFIAIIMVFLSLSFFSDMQTNKINWFAKLTNNKVYNPLVISKVLDNNIYWQYAGSNKNNKIVVFDTDTIQDFPQTKIGMQLLNNKGKKIQYKDNLSSSNQFSYRPWETPKGFYITLSNKDTGWNNEFTPSIEDIKDYFKNKPYRLQF